MRLYRGNDVNSDHFPPISEITILSKWNKQTKNMKNPNDEIFKEDGKSNIARREHKTIIPTMNATIYSTGYS